MKYCCVTIANIFLIPLTNLVSLLILRTLWWCHRSWSLFCTQELTPAAWRLHSHSCIEWDNNHYEDDDRMILVFVISETCSLFLIVHCCWSPADLLHNYLRRVEVVVICDAEVCRVDSGVAGVSVCVWAWLRLCQATTTSELRWSGAELLEIPPLATASWWSQMVGIKY